MGEDLLSLRQLYEEDAKMCKSLLECVAGFEYEILQKWFESLKIHVFGRNNTCSNPSSREFCNSKYVIPSGSLVEGCLLSRYFGQCRDFKNSYPDKMKLEFDIMFPIGQISAEQLIPCYQPGFYKLREKIDIMKSVPKIFHCMELGLKMLINFVQDSILFKHYTERGYFSIIMLQGILANLTPALVDNKYLFGVFGIDESVPRFKSSPDRHGPALCWTWEWDDEFNVPMKSINVDGVFCVLLKTWPDVANEWIFRERTSLWPTERLVNEIISKGCLLVAKNPQLNHSQEQCDAELDAHWRLSFSLAEICLSKKRSEKHNYCYFVFKSIFYFKFSELIKDDAMSSYLVKTIFMWMCESLDFSTHDINEIIEMLFQSFKHCLEKRFLPHYFIRTVNLVENLSEAVHMLALKIITNTLHELGDPGTRLLDIMSSTAKTFLLPVKSLIKSFQSLAWISFCWNSIGQTHFMRMNHVTNYKRIQKIASHPSVIGFCRLVAYIEHKSACRDGFINLAQYIEQIVF